MLRGRRGTSRRFGVSMRAAHSIRPRKRAWKALRKSLAQCLHGLEHQEFLIISHRGSNRFVQFASNGNGDLRMEATANVFIEPARYVLTVDDFAQMERLGWNRAPRLSKEPSAEERVDRDLGLVADESPNFFVDTMGASSWKKVARRAIRTLRDVYGIKHPRQLEYSAFHPNGTTLRFPTLGLLWRDAMESQRHPDAEDRAQMFLDGLDDDGIDDMPFA